MHRHPLHVLLKNLSLNNCTVNSSSGKIIFLWIPHSTSNEDVVNNCQQSQLYIHKKYHWFEYILIPPFTIQQELKNKIHTCVICVLDFKARLYA